MTTTSSRTLQLLALLQTRRFWLGTELADRLDVSLRTLRRDVDRLRELGYPVRADRGVGGGYQLDHGVSLPPLVLDGEEAVSVTVGLLTCAQTSITGVAEASVRALAKVIPVMPPRLRRQVDALRAATVPSTTPWAGAGVDSDALVLTAQVCRDSERITFAYTAADGADSRRRVEPLQLVTVGQRWYLVAYDLDRDDWRSFRLDRMREIADTGRRFRPRELPGGDAAAFVQDGLQRTGITATAELAAPADEVRRRTGRWAEVTELSADRCRIVIDTASLDWAVFTVGIAEAPVLAAEPPEFADLLRDWSRRLGTATVERA